MVWACLHQQAQCAQVWAQGSKSSVWALHLAHQIPPPAKQLRAFRRWQPQLCKLQPRSFHIICMAWRCKAAMPHSTQPHLCLQPGACYLEGHQLAKMSHGEMSLHCSTFIFISTAAWLQFHLIICSSPHRPLMNDNIPLWTALHCVLGFQQLKLLEAGTSDAWGAHDLGFCRAGMKGGPTSPITLTSRIMPSPQPLIAKHCVFS